jgi:hypothetical protein
MHMGRVIENAAGSGLYLKDIDPNRTNKGQWFIFDAVSKTLKNAQWSGKAITIKSSGKDSNGNLITESISSRWW